MQYAKPEEGEFMKKYGKLLPLFLAAPLLMSCGNKKVEQPKFADKGNKVEYSEFSEKYAKAFEECEYEKEEKAKSYELKSAKKTSEKITTTRSDKVIDSSETFDTEEGSGLFDAANLRIVSKQKETHAKVVKNANESTIEAKTVDKDGAYQKVTNKDKEFVAFVDNKEKTYQPMDEVTAEKKAEDIFDNYGKMMATSFRYSLQSLEMEYAFETEAMKEKYSFYANEKVFTIEIDKSVEKTEVKDMEDKVLYEETVTDKKIYQVDLTDGAVAWRTWSEEKTVREIKDFCGGYIAGDVWVGEELESYEETSTRKEVKTKEVALDKYKAIGFEA